MSTIIYVMEIYNVVLSIKITLSDRSLISDLIYILYISLQLRLGHLHRRSLLRVEKISIMSRNYLALFALALSGFLVIDVHSHGYIYDPPGRSTVWRVFPGQAPINYDDNALYCGTRDVCITCFFSYTDHVFY